MIVVPWYEDRFFYFGCSLAALARIFGNHCTKRPYSHRFYKWTATIPISGVIFHYLNRYRLKKVQIKLEQAEANKVMALLSSIGMKEGKQIDEHEDQLKAMIKRINH